MNKKFLACSRFFFLFVLWGSIYFSNMQKIGITYWQFNITNPGHWSYFFQMWENGWSITTTSEWFFGIWLVCFIPAFIFTMVLVNYIKWMPLLKKVLGFPIRKIKENMAKKKEAKKPVGKPKVTKKKSYKKTRPAPVRVGSGKIKTKEQLEAEKKEAEKEAKAEAKHEEKSSNREVSKSETKAAPVPQGPITGSSINAILTSAGYKVIENAKIAGKVIDFLGVCADHLLLCLVDKESGDWLADEERFNDEEPLWFSESNHRVSPVRNVMNMREQFVSQLSGAAKGMNLKPMVVINSGTIINAEDMFDVWKNLDVNVCRFENGGPDDIKELKSALTSVSRADDNVIRDVQKIVI